MRRSGWEKPEKQNLPGYHEAAVWVLTMHAFAHQHFHEIFLSGIVSTELASPFFWQHSHYTSSALHWLGVVREYRVENRSHENNLVEQLCSQQSESGKSVSLLLEACSDMVKGSQWSGSAWAQDLRVQHSAQSSPMHHTIAQESLHLGISDTTAGYPWLSLVRKWCTSAPSLASVWWDSEELISSLPDQCLLEVQCCRRPGYPAV